MVFTNKLEKLRTTALPLAVLGTLNDAAYKMKTETMPSVAKSVFKERQPNFFRANSQYQKATGMRIESMVSMVGFLSSGLHSPATNYAVMDLEQQEDGGTIHGKSFKALPAARKGGTGNVRANVRLSTILKAGNIINARDSKFTGTGTNGKMEQFIKASIHAGIGGYVLGGAGSGTGILLRVKGIKRVGRNIKFTKEKLYSFKKSGTATVRATGFMRKAALEVQREMETMYIIQANRQIRKALG